jgi:hypothetical protein
MNREDPASHKYGEPNLRERYSTIGIAAVAAALCCQGGGKNSGSDEAAAMDSRLGLLKTNDGVRLARAFSRIQDPKVRRIMADLVERAAGSEETSPA